MSRVATIPMHRTLFDSIGRSQVKLAAAQVQLATGKKAQDYAALGTETVRNLSARGLVARQESHALVANRLNTTLAIYDANIGGIDTAVSSLRNELLTAIGTGRAAGLQEAVEAAFQQYRSALNASEGGAPLFAGSRTDEKPFVPSTLAETAGLAAQDAFANDDVRASARVADGLDVQYGITASQLGEGLFGAFRTLAEAGTIAEEPSPAQIEALENAVNAIDQGLKQLRSVHAENGRHQQQVETLGVRAEDRALVLKDLISRNEDADMAKIASDLVQRRTVLEASYSAFAQLSGLSLVRFL